MIVRNAGGCTARRVGSALAALLTGLLLTTTAMAQGGDFDRAKNAYLNGDYDTALSVVRPMAEGGNSDAQVLLSLMYDNGQGLPQDRRKATEWLLRAADGGNSNAKHDIGLRYYRGQGVEQNYQTAADWWQKAASDGIPDSQFNLALLYHRGLGVGQDFIKARRYFKQAADKGHDLAQYSLATMHAFGHGGAKDYDAAFRLFQKAANRGTAQAQYNLGVFYENGYGVTRDLGEAKRWYRLAAAQNLQEAADRLKALELSGSTQPVGTAARPDKLQLQARGQPTPRETPSPAVSGIPAPTPTGRGTPTPATAATTAPPSYTPSGGDGDLVLREDWIRGQPGQNFTLQVVSLPTEADMLSFLGRYHWGREVAYAKVIVNGRTRYSGLYGSFANKGEAQQAVSELPLEMQKNKPWARNFNSIKGILAL